MAKEAFILTGKVEAVLVAPFFSDHVSRSVKKIELVRGYGVKGDNHAGTRLADVREKEFLSFGLAKGTEIANLREFSAVSQEELSEIAVKMNLPSLPHGCLGENLVLSGIPRLTELPTGTMLFFRKSSDQLRAAVLVVWKENKPCLAPGEALEKHFAPRVNLASTFPKAAAGKRGLVGSIFSSGTIHAGDEVVVRVPEQKIYQP